MHDELYKFNKRWKWVEILHFTPKGIVIPHTGIQLARLWTNISLAVICEAFKEHITVRYEEGIALYIIVTTTSVYTVWVCQIAYLVQ